MTDILTAITVPLAIAKALRPCLCTDTTRANMCGIHVQTRGVFVVYETTDGHTAARIEMPRGDMPDTDVLVVNVRGLISSKGHAPVVAEPADFPNVDAAIPSKGRSVDVWGIQPAFLARVATMSKELGMAQTAATLKKHGTITAGWAVSMDGPLGPVVMRATSSARRLADLTGKAPGIVSAMFVVMPMRLDT